MEYETCMIYGRKSLGNGFPSFLHGEFLKERGKEFLFEDKREYLIQEYVKVRKIVMLYFFFHSLLPYFPFRMLIVYRSLM